MKRWLVLLAVALVVSSTLWCCSKAPVEQSRSVPMVREREVRGKICGLEYTYRGLATTPATTKVTFCDNVELTLDEYIPDSELSKHCVIRYVEQIYSPDTVFLTPLEVVCGF